MGACCVSRDGGDHEIDLPMADQKSIVGNVFQKFEGSLPFQCSWVDAFERRVRNAARLTGGANELAPGQKEEFAPGEAVKEYSVTTLEDLRKTLTTPAWKDLQSDDSMITRLVTHKIFAAKGKKIDVEKLMCFGLLHCHGTKKYKSQVLYGIFQFGGHDRH